MLGLAVVVALMLALACQAVPPTSTPSLERVATATTPPLTQEMTPTSFPEPYPPPAIQPPVVLSPTVVPPTSTAPALLPEIPPVPGRAVTLHNGDVWLVEQGHAPEAITDVGDVAAIFGWNWNGTKLLLGRGRNVLGGDVGDTTELWLLDVASRQAKQFTTSNLVTTASWSSVDERLAYCEHGDVLTVATSDGETLHQLESVGCSFTWSPDGSSVAVETYTPDMITDDGYKYSVLAIWWLPDERLQVFSDAKDEAHYWPVWSTDGRRILFQRSCYAPDKQEQDGWYIAEVDSGLIRRLEGTPAYSAEEIRRSPRADQVAFRVGPDLYVMDFEGKTIGLVGQGHSLVWGPDGRTLFHRDPDNSFQVVAIETEVTDSTLGGAWPSPGLYIHPECFFGSGRVTDEKTIHSSHCFRDHDSLCSQRGRLGLWRRPVFRRCTPFSHHAGIPRCSRTTAA